MDFSDFDILFRCNVNYYTGYKRREELKTANIDNPVTSFAAKGYKEMG